MKDLVLPKNDGNGYVDIGNGIYAPATGYAVNQSPSDAGNSPAAMANDWQIDLTRQRMQALGLGYAVSPQRAREILRGSPDIRLDGSEMGGNGSSGPRWLTMASVIC